MSSFLGVGIEEFHCIQVDYVIVSYHHLAFIRVWLRDG